jgi:hypothetical protein
MPVSSGFSKPTGSAMIQGGPIGEFKVPGRLNPTCTLLSVLDVTDGVPPSAVNRTAEFSITAGKSGTIQNTTTVTTGRFLHVTWALPE